MKKYILLSLLIYGFLLIPDIAYSQTTEFEFDVINEIRNKIEDNSNQWITHIKKVALNVFYILATISFVLKFILEVMSKGEIDTKESIAFIIRFIITTGFFYYLLDNGIYLAQSLVASFTQLGVEATGYPPTFSNLLDVGLKLLQAGDNIGWSDFEIKIPFFVLAVLTILFLVIIMANLIIEEIAAAIMIYVGFFVLALGGMDYTRDSAIAYFKAILGISLKILTIILIMGITINIMQGVERDIQLNTSNVTDGATLIYQALMAFLTVFFLALLSMKLPDAVSNLVSSAWGNMSGLTLMGGIALAQNTAFKVATAISGMSGGVKNAVTGYKDYNKNKEIGQKKKEAEARGEDTSLNPMFNKQKNAGGKAYYGGKAVAASKDMYQSVSKKLSGVFGNSNNVIDSPLNNPATSEISNNSNNTENNKGGVNNAK